MIGRFIAGILETIFSGLAFSLTMLAIGAGIGVAAALARTLFGYGGAAALGAVMMLSVAASTVFSTKQDCKTAIQVLQLETQNAQLQHELEALNAVLAKEKALLVAEQQSAAANAQVAEKLNALIAKHEGDDSACIFTDELEAIGEFQ